MRLPPPVHPLLLRARHLVAVVQGGWFPVLTRDVPTSHEGSVVPSADSPWSVEAPDPIAFTRHTPLPQPDRTTCGSCVLVMLEMQADPWRAAWILAGPDPVRRFAEAARAMLTRTGSPVDRAGHLQLPWPRSQGTRPAALVRQLGGGWSNRVVDPRDPGAAYEAILGAGRPVPLYVGEGSWMQHIVLVTAADPDGFTAYDPACGHEVRRTREQFEGARLRLAGWDQPWLVIVPVSGSAPGPPGRARARRTPA